MKISIESFIAQTDRLQDAIDVVQDLVPINCPNPMCDEECNVCFSTGVVYAPGRGVDFRREDFTRATQSF